MSSYPAPTQNIEFFNPAFFTVDETALTLADANKLYFKKSGGIITGAVSMPSLTLNGVNIENKLLDININSNKLTDISYNNNTTTILNDLSVIGDITIGSVTITEPIVIGFGLRLTNVETTLTKITYEILGNLTKIDSNLNITGNLQLGTITNVENKLTEIDANSTKLTDISYNNNVTYILHDLSVNGILKLPNLPNVGTDILNNKQKITKISYDSGTSVTTIADTLKASGTMIVGSQNYNASDEFSKLQNISRGASLLTINDSIILTGNLDLPNFGDVDTILLDFDEKLTNISYTSGTNTTSISGNLQLGSITDVEDAINNAGTPFITYNTITEKLDIEKDIFLSGVTIGERTFNNDDGAGIMVRTLDNPSNNLASAGSIFEVQSQANSKRLWVGNNLTSSGSNKFLFGFNNTYGEEGLETNYSGRLNTDGSVDCTGLDVNGDINCGKLEIQEVLGTPPSTTGGSLTLTHNDDGGTSSIVFKSKKDPTDRGYISYTDDISGDSGEERSLLEIGCANDGIGTNVDNIALMPSGNVGVNTRTPQAMLDVNGDTIISGNLNIIEDTGTIPSASSGSLTLQHNNLSGQSSIVFKSANDATDYGYISYRDDFEDDDARQRSLLEIGVQNESPNDKIAIMGIVGINTRTPQTELDVNGEMNCQEIQVNSIPLNSFTNFILMYNATNPSTWGNGYQLRHDSSSTITYSHAKQFEYADINSIKGIFGHLGTYLIEANVMFRNDGTGRVNPVISIDIEGDTRKFESSTVYSPNWETAMASGYSQSNIFSSQYTRDDQGEVSNLSAKRIYRFTSTGQNVSIRTFINNTTGLAFTDTLTSFKVFNAGISFRYLGDFPEPTTIPG